MERNDPRFQLPEGWQWLELQGHRVYESRTRDGSLRAALNAYMYDPSDVALRHEGMLGAAIERGTVRELEFSIADLESLSGPGATHSERLENFLRGEA